MADFDKNQKEYYATHPSADPFLINPDGSFHATNNPSGDYLRDVLLPQPAGKPTLSLGTIPSRCPNPPPPSTSATSPSNNSPLIRNDTATRTSNFSFQNSRFPVPFSPHRGNTHAMSTTKLKTAAILLAACILILLAAVLVLHRTEPAPTPPIATAPSTTADDPHALYAPSPDEPLKFLSPLPKTAAPSTATSSAPTVLRPKAA